MQPSDFSKDKAGQIIKAPQGYWAFDPTPLPPPLTPTWELAGEISAADRALSELAVVFAPHSVSLVQPGADGVGRQALQGALVAPQVADGERVFQRRVGEAVLREPAPVSIEPRLVGRVCSLGILGLIKKPVEVVGFGLCEKHVVSPNLYPRGWGQKWHRRRHNFCCFLSVHLVGAPVRVKSTHELRA